MRQSNGEKQKFEFIQIKSCVWENLRILQMQFEDGKVKWKNFDTLVPPENYLELMENRLS